MSPAEEAVQVLCVDDPGFVDITVASLERDGRFEVVAETDATEACDRLRDGTVSIEAIMSDSQMPEVDGLTFLRCVREIQPDLPFILFTSEDVASDAISAGVTDYLQKGGREQFELLANRCGTRSTGIACGKRSSASERSASGYSRRRRSASSATT